MHNGILTNIMKANVSVFVNTFPRRRYYFTDHCKILYTYRQGIRVTFGLENRTVTEGYRK